MPIKDYNTDPDLNTTISGINIAEGCAPSGINNAIRQLMADVRAEKDERDAAQDERDAALREAIAEVQASTEQAQASADAAQASADAVQNSLLLAVPPGTVMAFAANSTPAGCLLCNGAAVSRTTYARLFAAIGTTYGTGDGSTTFNLPNLTDKFIQGSGTAGTSKAAGLPNVSGYFRHLYTTYETGGPFTAGSAGGTSIGQLASNNYGGHAYTVATEMHLSKGNSIYGKSTTVQPPALTMRFYIKY